MRRSFSGATVLISGAGGGLGRALAHRFGREGCRLVLLDRDGDGVRAVGDELTRIGVDCLPLTCDVTDEVACADAVRLGVERHGQIDVLVNNAGITHRSPFATTQPSVLRRVVAVNLFGTMHLTHAALPHLRRTRGAIVTLSSVAGYTPLVARTGYAASKHALHGFCDSLRTEVAADGIDVTLVCPSFIATGIDRAALGPDGGAATHAQVIVGRRLQVDDVADRIVRGVGRRRRLLLIGSTARAAWWLSRFAPRLYERIMVRRLRAEMR